MPHCPKTCDGTFLLYPLILADFTLRSVVVSYNKLVYIVENGKCRAQHESHEEKMIVDAAFNNFSGQLPVKGFRGWPLVRTFLDNLSRTFNFTDATYSVTDGGSSSCLSSCRQWPSVMSDSIAVIISIKGHEIESVKILTIFTSIVFSSNQFEGKIPKELIDFKALHLLNLSHNALPGQIPFSIGNLSQLESLDLLMNSLEGEILTELVNLNFLSILNLYFNHLTGRIPTGTKLESFEASSFEGNDGLYGTPLTKTPNQGIHPPLTQPPQMPPYGSLACEVHWDLVSAEVGLIFGIGIIVGLLLFWKRWRMRYC
ncbi:hypothetical protein PIB30_052736 [Stylosanthes scabra]|uniref:Uncharacterized protein n=1 Tax=Stylosanthes scabra TaxID=79078 RepID=A0ABU6TJ60_9FABA|nr:hypothetical protein [Stylosanthes scabra]